MADATVTAAPASAPPEPAPEPATQPEPEPAADELVAAAVRAEKAAKAFSSLQSRIHTAKVVGSKQMEEESASRASSWFKGVVGSSTYTVYHIDGAAENGAATVRSTRRFSEIARFHERFVEARQSDTRPVPLPPKNASVFFKSSDTVVAERMAGLQDWFDQVIQLGRRLGCPYLDKAIQNFLHGGSVDEVLMPAPDLDVTTWDAAGEWVFELELPFAGETYHIPHKLLLSADGVNVSFRASGHPRGGHWRGTGTWETLEGSAQVAIALSIAPDAASSVSSSALDVKMVFRKEKQVEPQGIEGAAQVLLGPRPRCMTREQCVVDGSEKTENDIVWLGDADATTGNYQLPCCVFSALVSESR